MRIDKFSTRNEKLRATLKVQKSNESFFIEDDAHMRIFEELIDNSTEAKIRRYLERKRREKEERHNNMLHPESKDELQDMIINAIEKNGPKVDLNYIDVSGIDDISYLFFMHYSNNEDKNKILRSFNGNISDWEVDSVEDMSFMFAGAKSFNGDISEWDVSNVTDMSSMFNYAESFNKNLSSWDVGSVTSMNGMFDSATNFNQNISKWEVGSVKDMNYMFARAKNFDQNLSGWDVTGKNTKHMFKDCPIEDKNKPKGLK